MTHIKQAKLHDMKANLLHLQSRNKATITISRKSHIEIMKMAIKWLELEIECESADLKMRG